MPTIHTHALFRICFQNFRMLYDSAEEEKEKINCENVAIAKRLPFCLASTICKRLTSGCCLSLYVCERACVCDCGYFLQLQLVVMQSQITNRAANLHNQLAKNTHNEIADTATTKTTTTAITIISATTTQLVFFLSFH